MQEYHPWPTYRGARPVKLLRAGTVDKDAMTVTLPLYRGELRNGKPVWYILTDTNDERMRRRSVSTEASDAVVATLDNATFTRTLGDIGVGGDDGAFSAVERLFPIVNGPTGAGNPQRQGLNSALSDVGKDGKPLPPLHVIGGLPTLALDYSPLWDVNLGEWTKAAIAADYRSRQIDEFQLLEFVRRGFITCPGGKEFGSTGIVVNCPIVVRFL